MPLGALFEDSVEALGRAGLDVAPLRDAGRRLVVEAADGTTYITTRPSDVPTYVESGAADIGIVGKDVLNERSPDVYELLDLRFGGCRMVYATREGEDPTPAALEHLGLVRVATKYPVAATGHFTATGRQAEVVKVNGSVELAPLVGLAHGIVDLVATGPDAARERAGGARGDLPLLGPRDRQPGEPDAAGRRDRRAARPPGGGAAVSERARARGCGPAAPRRSR